MEKKTCTKCGEEKVLSEYYKKKTGKMGTYAHCIICNKNMQKENYQLNKETIKQKRKKYYYNNLNYYKEQNKLYLKNNGNKLKDYKKNYKKLNNDKIKEYTKFYNKNNKEQIKLYKEKNKESLRIKNNIYVKNKYDTDIIFKLKHKCRVTILKSLKKLNHRKNSKSIEILCCSYEDFKLYLESKFDPWMSWDNHGLYNGQQCYGWDIDHIKPVSSANTEEDVIRLNHYTNLQPLCSHINRDIKKNSLDF